MITIHRIQKVTQKLNEIPNAYNLNCLNFFENNIQYGIPLYQISPYVLKDKNGCIFENIWQFTKVYEKVDAQHEIKAGKLIWSHPAETHILDNQFTPEFWNWRTKGITNKYAVRYPNGFYGRHRCLFALWLENDQYQQLGYIAARKKIYCKLYYQFVQETEAFKMLKALYDAGHHLVINEIDVRESEITEEVLVRELNNDQAPFGHGYVLATCLMGLTHIFEN